MKIKNKFPPNYDEICEYFNVRGRMDVVFTYGDILYAPGGNTISKDLEIHEETHSVQQGKYHGGPEAWWKLYLVDANFRISQEVEAYGRQYKYVRENADRPERRRMLRFFVESLSGPIYGHAISHERAKALIEEASV